MNQTNIFEIATRQKMRFPYKGLVSVEDLWDLSVSALDSVFKALNAQAKRAQEESLLNVKSKEDEAVDVQIAIVKHIVSVKLAEKEAREQDAARREQKQKIMGIIAAKKDAELQNLSVEELEKLLAD